MEMVGSFTDVIMVCEYLFSVMAASRTDINTIAVKTSSYGGDTSKLLVLRKALICQSTVEKVSINNSFISSELISLLQHLPLVFG